MIERGALALNQGSSTDVRDQAECVLRAALNDPKEPERPLAGQTSLYDFLHDERV